MEENLIHGEIEEELESGADSGSYGERETAVKIELRGAELENYGIEPRREADERKSEDYVYGQSNSGVGARVESLFLVDEECNYLRQKVRNIERNEERKSATLTLNDRIIKDEPVECLRAQSLDRGDVIKNRERRNLNDTCAEADDYELDKLPECVDAGALTLCGLVDIV